LTPVLLALVLSGTPQVESPEPKAPPPDEAAKPPHDELEIDPVEPDFVVVNLPTTARLPKGKLVFRVTHRFARGLGAGDFGDLAADFFSLDGGAQNGLELRYGLFDATQLWIHRTSDRTIAFHLTQGLLRQDGAPLSLQADLTVEGLDNFSEEYSPRIGVTLSRKLGERAALYVSPAFVGNTNLFDTGDDSSFVLGLGGRLRLTENTSLLAEAHPRLAGYDGGRDPLVAFGIERRVGGHCFQLNVANDLATTPAQLARGQVGPDDWFLGFNISRKFY
jgi:hypothetical protein